MILAVVLLCSAAVRYAVDYLSKLICPHGDLQSLEVQVWPKRHTGDKRELLALKVRGKHVDNAWMLV
jgi:hypothetical protein